jgi:hypothetical protein
MSYYFKSHSFGFDVKVQSKPKSHSCEGGYLNIHQEATKAL